MRVLFFFFFNDTATTEIYTLSLHDALPISDDHSTFGCFLIGQEIVWIQGLTFFPDVPTLHNRVDGMFSRLNEPDRLGIRDRKSTRLNSSHSQISYAVFCLKKKKKKTTEHSV